MFIYYNFVLVCQESKFFIYLQNKNNDNSLNLILYQKPYNHSSLSKYNWIKLSMSIHQPTLNKLKVQCVNIKSCTFCISLYKQITYTQIRHSNHTYLTFHQSMWRQWQLSLAISTGMSFLTTLVYFNTAVLC